MLTAHVRDFCHRISLWAALWAGADGVSCWMFIAYRRPSARIAGRRLPDMGARSRVLHGRFTVKAARRESPGAGRQRMTLPIVRQEIVRRGMVQYGIVQRGFSPASERLSDNSQRNTGVFNDLPVTVQGISGQPLTGRKPDNSIPSLLLSDPAVSLLPAGFLFFSSPGRAFLLRPTTRHPERRELLCQRLITPRHAPPTMARQHHEHHDSSDSLPSCVTGDGAYGNPNRCSGLHAHPVCRDMRS